MLPKSYFLAFVCSFLFLAQHTLAQNEPIINWQKCIGGTDFDQATSIVRTFDGSFVVVGPTGSINGDVDSNKGENDCFLVKLSATGNILWKRSFGGSKTEQPTYLLQTPDSGFIVTVYTNSNDGDVDSNRGIRDAWIVKLNSSGVIQWSKTYGGSGNDVPLCIQQTADGGYIVSGWSESSDGDVAVNKGGEDAWVIKLNASGALVWKKTFGGSLEDHASSIIQTSDGGYLFAGSVKSSDGDITNFHGGEDVWVVKLSATGTMTWQKTFGGTGIDHAGDHGFAGSIMQTFDGKYLVAGWTNSTNGDVTFNHGTWDAWLLKLNTNGTLAWQKTYGGSNDDEAYYMVQMPDSSIIVTGLTNSTDGDVDTLIGFFDVWTYKISAAGNLLWEQTYGSPSGNELAQTMAITPDTCVIVAGYTMANGGNVSGYHGGYTDFWVVRLKNQVVINDIGSIHTEGLALVPNPATQEVKIKGYQEALRVSLYNTTGQKILETEKRSIDVSSLAPGLYLVEIRNTAGNLLATKRLIKQ